MGGMSAPSLRTLTGIFFRAGALTFGGGNPATAALQRELVANRGWLSDTDFALCYAVSRITPGTNMLAFCTAAGWRLRRGLGSLAALLASSVPGAEIVVLLARGYEAWHNNPLVITALQGALAAAVGIVLASSWLLLRPYLTAGTWVRMSVIAATSFVLAAFLGFSPIQVLGLAALTGCFWRGPTQ
jgi:chromate transporter